MSSKKDIHPKIRKLARNLGVQFRFSKIPREANIYGLKMPRRVQAAYVGQGVVWVNSQNEIDPADFNIAILHEIGHAILDFFPLRISQKQHEIKANAIALGFAATMRLPVRHALIRSMSQFTKMTGLKMPKPEAK